MVRVKYANEPKPAHDNAKEFQRGDVVIGNDDFGKYKNELQIVLEPHSDPRKNLVGKIPPEELMLLDFVKPWTKFKFVPRNWAFDLSILWCRSKIGSKGMGGVEHKKRIGKKMGTG